MLHVHRSARGTALVAALADLLSRPLPDPFAPEVVAVPARGVERWIAQRLSHRLGAVAGDGVCARVAFPRPDDLLDDAVAAALPAHGDAVRAWHPDRVAWSLLEVLDACGSGEPWCAALVHHLAQGSGLSSRRYGVARRLAGLLSSVGSARPELLRAWARGEDDVPDDLRWQPELWRRVRERTGVPHPAELLDEACAALRRSSGERVSLYGVSRLDTARLQVLAALAASRDVHLFLHHPSRVLWEQLAAEPVHVRRAGAPQPARHPLLASLSRDLRELQLRLQAAAPLQVHHHDADSERTTLLQRLQDDLRADRLPAQRGPTDRSVQVHACHGRARQVEVLREVVLGLLADDPSLEPRDVLVMCPDVEAYAPLVAAAFGEGSAGAGLRVALADRSPRRTNPLLALAATLLDLAGSRATATQVLDLAGSPPVRLRFGFDDSDVEQLRSWAVGTGVRWGLGAEHRGPWQMEGVAQGTWRSGLDRLLSGLAMDDDDLFGGVLPYGDVDPGDLSLAGRAAELLDRLEAALARLSGSHHLEHWLSALETGVAELADVPHDGAWQQAQLARELDEVRAAAAGSVVPVGLADVVALLARRLEGRPTSTSFRTGGLTVCTLTPMRSVPHRVVCLLGLDDGAFPRGWVADGDDVLARDPHLGERDPRSEDRQLLLDAVGAAQDVLVVTYAGADPRTGAPLPPAVPLGELLDALDLTAQAADGRPARDTVVVRHPLQPFDPANFTAGALGRPGPLSFDPGAHAAARAALRPRLPAPGLVPAPLPRPDDAGDVELARLVQFWQHPARGFLRQRLDVTTASWEEEPDDALPVELDALQLWAVGERVLRARLRGVPAAAVCASETARGDLPPGRLADAVLAQVCARADALAAAAAPHRVGEARTLDVEVALGAGRRLLGSVSGLHDATLLTVTSSSLRARQRLRAWVELLALTVGHPGGSWRAVVVGRSGARATTWAAGPLDPDRARAVLLDLVALRDVGLRTPLPLPTGTAEAFARARTGGALKVWQSGWERTGEDDEAEHELCWGPRAPFEVLRGWRSPVLPDVGFPDLVARVWQPLLDAEASA